MDWERFGIYVFSAFYGYACLTAPYKGRRWLNRLTVFIILLLLMWLPACDDTRTITETEYVDRDVIVTEPYYTRTVYDENMGEFTAEQQDELQTKGYINMRLFYKPQNGSLVWASTMLDASAITSPMVLATSVTTNIDELDYVAGKVGDCARLAASESKTQTIVFDGLPADMPVGAISFWAQITGAPQSPSGAEVAFTTKNVKVRLYKYGGTTYWGSNGATGTPGAGWHHFYVVWNSSTNNIKTYVDGELVNNTTISANAPSVPTISLITVGAYSMAAMIDAVQLFNGPIDVSTALYNAGSGTESIVYQ
jgi:hypothetical protein